MPEITKQDALRWLDMQRDAINTEIAYAAPSDKNQYFGNLRIVNWLADRLNEMTAVEYFETQREMFVQKEPAAITATLEQARNPRLAVEIAGRWKEEHDGNDYCSTSSTV